MNKVLVSGYIGFDNFGDEAIFYALSNHLKKMNYKVSVLCGSPEKVSKRYDVEAFYYKSPLQVLKAIFNTDILISGGGSLLQNKTGNLSLFYYLFIILLSKIFLKKVIIFSQGFEPINGKLPQLLTKIVLKTVDFISARDEKSLDLLSAYKLKADLTSDPVYSLVSDIEINQNKDGLLIQLRDFKGINDNFIQDFACAISKNYTQNISVFSFQDKYDLKICEQFIEELKKYNVSAKLIKGKNIEKTIDTINNYKYMISTRLHGAIISNALKTKTFTLIYDEKIRTLSEELNIKNIDILNYSKEELNSKLDNFFKNEMSENKIYRKFDWDILDNYLTSGRM